MKRFLLAALTALFLGSASCGWLGPMYEVGDVSGDSEPVYDLEPPVQRNQNDQYWQVTDNIELYFYTGESDGSTDSTPILVIHGGPGTPALTPWTGLNAVDYAPVYYYHQRGCGYSTKPISNFALTESRYFYNNMQVLETELGIGANLADIERIRRILGSDQLILVGHSYGAFLASLYSAEFPERVKKMVLVSPAPLFKMPSDFGGLYVSILSNLPAEMEEDYRAYIAELFNIQDLFSKNEEELQELNDKMGTYYYAAMINAGKTMPETDYHPELVGGWYNFAYWFSTGRKYDYTKSIKAIDVPVLVIHGDEDFQTLAESEWVASLFPNAELEIIPSAGHFSFEEMPERFAELVGDFLAE